MPRGAVFAGVTAGADGLIYVVSGNPSYDARPTRAVQIYNPKSSAWSEGPELQLARSSSGAALGPDGKVYVTGGRVSVGESNTVAEAYDPILRRWSRVRPMPTPREALCVGAARGADGRLRIYALGGRNGLQGRVWRQLGVNEAYDPTTDAWTVMAPMPTPRHAFAACVGPDGRIYAMGGTDNSAFAMKRVEIYDPARDVWTTGAPMPFGQECAAAAAVSGPQGEVLVFGGWGAGKRPLRNVAAYNPTTDKWRSLPSLPFPRAAAGAVAMTGADGATRVYLLGGTGEGGDGKRHTAALVETSAVEYSIPNGFENSRR